MRRAVVFISLLIVGVLGTTIAAIQQAPAARVVTVTKLSDNLFMLGGMGGGGNTAVFIQSNGVTVVDTKNPAWGQPILDEIRKLTDKPVTTIINTHTHGDHVSGNVEFPANVAVVVHVNTAANMKEMRMPSGIQPPAGGPTNIFRDNGGRGLPTRTYSDRLTLGSGADRVDLYYFGRGHTNGDTWVVFPAARVMHAGDIFSGKNIPLLDANNSGSGLEIGDTLAKAADATASMVDGIITGHSTVMTIAELREYAQFNRDFVTAVRSAKQSGMTVEQIAAAWKIPARYAGYAEPAAARLRSNVQIVYDEVR